MLPLVFAGVASAQPSPPTFGLQAPSSSCPNSDSGYTCVPSAAITSYSIPPPHCTPNCHYEYCFTTQQSGGQPVCQTWYNAIPIPISLGNVTDKDPSGPPNNSTSEANGPNGCTYEPTSNTGVVIVRNLLNSSSPSIETYSIINTGLMP